MSCQGCPPALPRAGRLLAWNALQLGLQGALNSQVETRGSMSLDKKNTVPALEPRQVMPLLRLSQGNLQAKAFYAERLLWEFCILTLVCQEHPRTTSTNPKPRLGAFAAGSIEPRAPGGRAEMLPKVIRTSDMMIRCHDSCSQSSDKTSVAVEEVDCRSVRVETCLPRWRRR